MPTLDATMGGASANSYLAVSEADAYFDERLHSDNWTGATADDKARALIMATRNLDVRVEWSGSMAGDTQALAWPRFGLVDADGYWILTTEIPQRLKDAVCELALILIGQDTTALAGTAGISALSVGPIKLEIDKTDRVQPIPPTVLQLVSLWGAVKGELMVDLIRG